MVNGKGIEWRVLCGDEGMMGRIEGQEFKSEKRSLNANDALDQSHKGLSEHKVLLGV